MEHQCLFCGKPLTGGEDTYGDDAPGPLCELCWYKWDEPVIDDRLWERITRDPDLEQWLEQYHHSHGRRYGPTTTTT